MSKTLISDLWRQTDRWKWKLNTSILEGVASITEVEGGYKTNLVVKEDEFGMTLEDVEEFFESREEAERVLFDRMTDVLEEEE